MLSSCSEISQTGAVFSLLLDLVNYKKMKVIMPFSLGFSWKFICQKKP
jgi:hypothetical protein